MGNTEICFVLFFGGIMARFAFWFIYDDSVLLQSAYTVWLLHNITKKLKKKTSLVDQRVGSAHIAAGHDWQQRGTWEGV